MIDLSYEFNPSKGAASMAEYRYHYNYNGQNGGKKPSNNAGYWVVTAVLFFVFPPAAILMLILKLFGDKQATQRGQHPHYAQQNQATAGARTVQAEQERQTTRQNSQAAQRPRTAHADKANQKNDGIKDGSGFIITGAILSALFGFTSLVTLSESLWLLSMGEFVWFLEELLPQLCFLSGGLGALWVGLRRRKKARRYRKYLAMIGRREAITLASLSDAMRLPLSEIEKDLEDMLGDGILPSGYLDYGRGVLVLSGDGLWDEPKKEEKQEEPKMEEGGENAVLQEIRAINDSIDHPKLSQQIDQIGMITAKIFDYQKRHPEKSPQLHSFLSYYLPTTLKILRAYAQLEDQEIAGENIIAAMARIEGMMDKVVEGFEKQLDQLFENQAMDITTDVQVLEQMLAKDGLANGNVLRLEL